MICGANDPNKPTILNVSGFLLDGDDVYFYLGEGPLEVTIAVKRSIVELIQISDEESDANLQVLEDLPIPKDEEGKN